MPGPREPDRRGTAANYLLGDRHAAARSREAVEVLRRNPDTVAAVAGSLDFEHRYTPGVIGWAPEDEPTDAEIEAVRDTPRKRPGGTEPQPIRLDRRAAARARRRSRACTSRRKRAQRRGRFHAM